MTGSHGERGPPLAVFVSSSFFLPFFFPFCGRRGSVPFFFNAFYVHKLGYAPRCVSVGQEQIFTPPVLARTDAAAKRLVQTGQRIIQRVLRTPYARAGQADEEE